MKTARAGFSTVVSAPFGGHCYEETDDDLRVVFLGGIGLTNPVVTLHARLKRELAA